MIGYYNYSVIVTYLGLSSAIAGIVLALESNFKYAVLCLIVCGLCDMFDGTIARRCKRTEDEKSFGIQIDSLCDLICFGAFPAVIVYSFCKADAGDSFRLWFTTFCLIFYVLAAVIRLGYFNVSEMKRSATGGEKRLYYEGLPVTSIALLLPLALVLDALIPKYSFVRFYNVGLVVIGILFITRTKIKKPYFRGLLFLALLGAVVFLLVCIFGGRFDA